MVSLQLRKMLRVAAALGMACVAASVMAAATPSYPVIYTATGTFGATPVSGADTLRMAGEPFTIKLSANTAMAPYQHGKNWASYQNLKMSGTVYSGLTGSAPIPVGAINAGLQLTTGPKDIINAGFAIGVIGIQLNVTAHIYVPGGTLANPYIRVFPLTNIGSGSTVTYADSTASTVLSIASGTVVAAYPTGAMADAFDMTSAGDLLALARIPDFSPVLFVRRSSYFPVPASL